MPHSWHDHHAANKEAEEDRTVYHELVANRKPYFMRYIYPALDREYNNYVKNSDKNAIREFGMSVKELMALDELTPRQETFLKFYKASLPVGDGPCVMNKICKRFEDAFDGFLSKKYAEQPFDYTIMKSGLEYTEYQKRKIVELYYEYNRKVRNFVVFQEYERVDEYEAIMRDQEMRDDFLRQCSLICPGKDLLCDILLDVCYKKNSTKKFVWDISGDEIIHNLLARNGGEISIPIHDPDGGVLYGGERFMLKKITLEGLDESDTE